MVMAQRVSWWILEGVERVYIEKVYWFGRDLRSFPGPQTLPKDAGAAKARDEALR